MEQLKLSKHRQFGVSSEKSEYDQLSLFNEAETAAGKTAKEPELKEVKAYHRKKSRASVDRLPADLPVEVVEHSLTEDEQTCPDCGRHLHVMGHETREELKLIPAKAVIVRHVQSVYACRHCEKTSDHVPIVKAPIADVRIDKGCLFIRNSKFKKDHLVPLHSTVAAKLTEYRAFVESKIGVGNDSDYFFVTSYGHRFNTRAFEYAFQLVRPLVVFNTANPPRLYDLRHTFACNTIKRWHEAGEDVNRKLYLLSTYMGHVKPEDTYWYLSATPELLGIAARKFESRFGGDGV